MKVGFFLENKYYDNIDFSMPENGNPGIRGTQYMFWQIAYLLSKRNIEVHMFAPNISTLPKTLFLHRCETELEAVEMAKKIEIDVIVLRGSEENKSAYDEALRLGQKCIVWSHNFESNKLANMIADNQMIKANVCVGRQQYERLIDHKAFSKSTYIYNAIDHQNYIPTDDAKENIVVYIGSLEKIKGFYKLARVWKKIVRKVPDARLIVLGKGNMGSNNKLGKYGLASKKSESEFMRHLLDKNQKILPNVNFMGTVGGELKMELMRKAKVGVVNPTGIGETFCIGAIEFQTLKVPVVSKRGNGLLDTVQNENTGLLVKNEQQLYHSVVRLLRNNIESEQFGRNGFDFVRKSFNFEGVVDLWEQLLNIMITDKQLTPKKIEGFFFDNFKWLRIANSKLQMIGIKTPSVLVFNDIVINAKKLLHTICDKARNGK